ncbi:NADPH-dependent oxidoreductase [Enterococcus devriesei]|uniref:NADPH-dependent oxidoreductase n=1 Tax=Enterococcus devriesei TaxID=319970 RepID=UPI0036D2672F
MELLETMIQHTSVRSFTDQKLSAELQEQLVLAAQSASSSNFLQACSLIQITDNVKRKAIETIAKFPVDNGTNGQFYIFVADLNKHAQVLQQQNLSTEHLSTMESLVVAIVDTALAAQSMAVYAESVELGICYVGGIRNDLFKMKDLLDLPKFTYPVFGLFVGYPAEKNEVKPRLPKTAILNTNTYQPFTPAMLADYDEVTTTYYLERSTNMQATSWSEKVRHHFAQARRSNTIDFLKKQGFVF